MDEMKTRLKICGMSDCYLKQEAISLVLVLFLLCWDYHHTMGACASYAPAKVIVPQMSVTNTRRPLFRIHKQNRAKTR